MPALAAMGWSASGVVAGSTAAAWQSSIGAVASGSLFASLQSLGATGAATLQAVAGIGGALAATASGASRMIPNFVNTPYRYLYDGDLNDKKKLEKLISCKEIFLSNQN
ncbi:hypothetical protein CROQUDRAFT_130915 [Cronartium quercuum f. sp. fusiforme G11]|uniref:Uncharacterized protein n=1 Tax=Cronartium quercuum f. sp. fusiforme G11 TaxID=708437 RepID=A0A9P6NQQ3_9BASI|nr:hypothetical protein CROQUDRAFT_130915 [Cronartium quercuum f. sp. fusiforme G11]